MAMRENTGLQIALILFVMITVVLAVTTYLYFRASEEAIAKNDETQDKLDVANAGLAEKIEEIDKLRSTLGYESSTPISDVMTNFDADMAKYGKGFNQKRDYRALPGYLALQLVDKNTVIEEKDRSIAQLQTELNQARAQEAKVTAEYLASSKAAADDLASQRTQYTTTRQQTVAKMDGIQAAFDEASREVSTIKAAKDKETDALINRVGKLDQISKNLRAKIESIQNPTASGVGEKPDGRITWVSQRGGNVYINLGSADGLRRSTIFTVYDAGVINLAQTDPKASIEVTTIRGPHLAEARIVEDVLSNPILSQDNIYSPVWDPGQKTHFALVGFMDIDKDGKSDRNLIRTLIARNGGVIDAEVLDDGSRDGKITINTRYLVQGEQANEKSKAEALRSYSQMIKEASDLGVETISVERLLSDMGWRGNERTVGSGTDPSGGEFKARPKEVREPSNPTFQPRTRPGGQTRRGSAY